VKILVAIPVGKRDHAESEMCRGITDLLLLGKLPIGQVLWGWRDLGGAGSVWMQREFAAKAMLHGDYSDLLFVDSDIGAPVEAFQALVAMNKPVAVGCYPTAEDQPVPATFRLHGPGDTGHPHLGVGVERIDWGGVGFALIKRSVFEQVPGPWFLGAGVNEDVTFFTKLRAAKIEVWCDYRIPLVHPYTVWLHREHMLQTAKYQAAILAGRVEGKVLVQ